MIRLVPCIRCRFYVSSFRCMAFPKGIPEKIVNGEIDHSQPYPGDRGYQFQLFDGTNKEVAWLREFREAQEEDTPDTPAR